MYEHFLDESALISECLRVQKQRNESVSVTCLYQSMILFFYIEMIECMFLGFEKNIFFSSCNCIVMYDPCDFVQIYSPQWSKPSFTFTLWRYKRDSLPLFFANIYVENYLIVSIVITKKEEKVMVNMFDKFY